MESHFAGGCNGREPADQRRKYKRRVFSLLSWDDPLQKGMATHSSVLAWRIPWTEEPGGLQSKGSQRVGPDRSDLSRTRYT